MEGWGAAPDSLADGEDAAARQMSALLALSARFPPCWRVPLSGVAEGRQRVRAAFSRQVVRGARIRSTPRYSLGFSGLSTMRA